MGYYVSMKHKWRTVRALPLADWGALLQAWFALGVAGILLRLWPLARLQELAIGRRACALLSADEALQVATRLHRLVESAARYQPLPTHCLERALVLYWLLGRRGIETEFCIGVHRQGGGLLGHAWVAYRGHPIGQATDVAARYAPLQGQGLSGRAAWPLGHLSPG